MTRLLKPQITPNADVGAAAANAYLVRISNINLVPEPVRPKWSFSQHWEVRGRS